MTRLDHSGRRRSQPPESSQRPNRDHETEQAKSRADDECLLVALLLTLHARILPCLAQERTQVGRSGRPDRGRSGRTAG